MHVPFHAAREEVRVGISRLSAGFAVGLCAAVAACGSTDELSPASPSHLGRDKVEGVVSERVGICNSIVFTVEGVTVITNGATRFEDPCASIVNGTRVEVEGTRQANGSILASEVEIDD